jgi:hypothetical protein
VDGQPHASAALPREKTRYPLYRRLDEPHDVSTGAANIAATGIRSPDLPTRSVVAIPATLSRPAFVLYIHKCLIYSGVYTNPAISFSDFSTNISVFEDLFNDPFGNLEWICRIVGRFVLFTVTFGYDWQCVCVCVCVMITDLWYALCLRTRQNFCGVRCSKKYLFFSQY